MPMSGDSGFLIARKVEKVRGLCMVGEKAIGVSMRSPVL